jgi:hypothetical protein
LRGRSFLGEGLRVKILLGDSFNGGQTVVGKELFFVDKFGKFGNLGFFLWWRVLGVFVTLGFGVGMRYLLV